MSTDSGDRRPDPLQGPHQPPPGDEPVIAGPQHQDLDPAPVPPGRGLISGLLGLNVVLLGAALVSAQLFNAGGLQTQEARIFLLLLMGVSVAWMLWYLLWARKQPDMSPHQDHHAGGVAATSKRGGCWCWLAGLMRFSPRSRGPPALRCSQHPPVRLHDGVSDGEEGM